MKNYSDEQFFDAPYRGVTSVLNAIFGNKFEKMDIPERILKAAGERGTAVHKYIEDWLGWYNRRFKPEDEFAEQRIINKKLGVKGIIDCIAVVNDKICMIDWKTSSNLDEWSTECQLQLYYMMLLKGNKEQRDLAKKIDELRCLSLTKTGYRWFKFSIDKKLGNAILELWNKHFREIAEAEKLEEKKKIIKGPIIL